VVKTGVKREDLVNFLEENLIETRFLLPLLNQPVYKKIFGDIENCSQKSMGILELLFCRRQLSQLHCQLC